MPESEKILTYEETIGKLRTMFGPQMILSERKPIQGISTGVLSVDLALGTKGFGRGYITEVFGPKGGGKSTLCLGACIEACLRGEVGLYIDLENKLPPDRPLELGADPDRTITLWHNTKKPFFDALNLLVGPKGPLQGKGLLAIVHPYSGTVTVDLIVEVLKANLADIIVVDSVSALVTTAELDASSSSDHFPGMQARFMSQNLKSVVQYLGLARAALVFINQIREKIGVMFGSPETTSGGNALKFYAATRARLTRTGMLGPEKNRIGASSRLTVVESSLASPRRSGGFDIIWATGVDKIADTLSVAVATGIVEGTAGYYKLEGENIGHGREMAKSYLREHPDLVAKIRELVLQQKDSTAISTAEGESNEAEPAEE